jgi:predicted phage terminase large subunit-like protein
MEASALAADAMMRQHLDLFIARAFLTVDGSQPYRENWHIEVIADHLERAFRREIRRLLITLPPRSLKSIATSVAFPAWALGHDPTLQLICASYSNELSQKLARDCRNVMQAPWYQRAFPHTRLNPKKLAVEDFETTRSGYRLATSVGGTLTGRGAAILIIDDPLKAQDAMSKPARESLKQWYDGTLYTRLNDKTRDVIILIQQRVHLDDLVAHVLEKDDWVHLNLPAIATARERFDLKDGRIYTRAPGELLHPAREPLSVLEEARRALGGFFFEAQYQQCPVPETGNVVRWEWFQSYETVPPPAYGEEDTIQSWDIATTAGDGSDWSVCTTWAQRGERYYLLDVLRARLPFPELKRRIYEQRAAFAASTVLVEDAGVGTGLIQQLRAESFDVIARRPERSKVDRMAAQTALIEAGRVFLPKTAPWLDALRTELLAFPQSRHDDQVDSISQFLGWIGGRVRHLLF